MREIPDNTGRFSRRPYYTEQELDRECELIITKFLKAHRGKVEYPVSTDDITTLIEQDASDLDLYADLTPYGTNVEGMTVFTPGRKPKVAISAEMANDSSRENRLRTTLTHEYGHVHFHAYLWSLEPPSDGLLGGRGKNAAIYCKRDTMIEAPKVDWMEWQAGFVCGALLMPRSALQKLVAAYQEKRNGFGPIALGTHAAAALIERVSNDFQVSRDAARVRLTRMEILGKEDRGPSLFT